MVAERCFSPQSCGELQELTLNLSVSVTRHGTNIPRSALHFRDPNSLFCDLCFPLWMASAVSAERESLNVLQLLAYSLEFFFYCYNEVRNLGVVRFRADGICLAVHFLNQKV